MLRVLRGWFRASSKEDGGERVVERGGFRKYASPGGNGKNSVAVVLLALVWLSGCYSPPKEYLTDEDPLNFRYPHVSDAPVRNIILLIGDGMGLAQITACRIHTYGTEQKMAVEKMPVTGYLYTHSVDKLITDSAAGATALAAGFKTRNGMISMSADTARVKTILEAAREKGKATGLVATSSVTHATPACFAAHVPSRQMQPEIADQLIDAGLDVLLGGGRGFFIPQSEPGSQRSDERNLLKTARERGYRVIDRREELPEISAAPVVGLFKNEALANQPDEPSLAEMTRKAIDLLRQNPRGFFLMVEGSQIDWGSHDNNLEYTNREMLSFDQAVEAALEFARKDGHTLVVVTADHETGGMAIEGGSMSGHEVVVDWTTGSHTGVPVPIFAFGPHSLRFSGVHNNTIVPQIFARIWHINPFPQIEF